MKNAFALVPRDAHKFLWIRKICIWFKTYFIQKKRIGRGIQHDNALSRGSITKEPNHTHTHTLPRIGCLIISNVTITRQYDSQVNITNYNLSLSSINLCTASKSFYLIHYLDLLIRTVTTHTKYLS